MARTYSDETKAAAMAALLEGQSINVVSKEYDIPRSTVGAWAKDVRNGGVQPIPDTKKGEIGELLVRYVKANLRALEAQAEVFADPEWLARQAADEAAVLHGVMTDKAVRLLEAFGRAQGHEPD